MKHHRLNELPIPKDAITKEEQQILAILRKTNYGKSKVKIRDGRLTLAEERKP